MLFGGLGVLVSDDGSQRLSRNHFNTTEEYNEYLSRQRARNSEKNATGLGLMISGVLIEVGSIIYGFVMPAVHLKRARANAVAANDTGFKFNLAYTSSGGIAPQISYKIRY